MPDTKPTSPPSPSSPSAAGTPQSDRDQDQTQDQDLLTQARDHIAEACGGAMPAGIEVAIEDKRIRLSGRVPDLATAERIAKAAAIGPGILGVHNDLQAADASEPAPIVGADAAGAANAADDAAASGEHGAPLPPVPGPIHHKV